MADQSPILGASLDSLRATHTSVKWALFEPDVLPVWVAEMDARPCPQVVEAVTEALQRGDTGYALADEYLTAVADFTRRRWGWNFNPRQARPVADVMTGIRELLRTVAPQAPVVLSPPVYDAFYKAVSAVGRQVVTARLGADLRLDPEALEQAFAQAGPGSAYLLCNPHNPTGTVHTATELATLAQLAKKYGVLVISDEIHAPLVFSDAEFVPYLSVPGTEEGIAVVSASKAWNLAGLKVATLVGGEAATARVTGLPEIVTHGANHLAVIGHTAAYTEGGDWLKQVVGEIADRRQLLVYLLKDQLPQVHPVDSPSTYLSWLDCRELGLDDPAATFRSRGRVALSAGTAYDPDGGAGWARFNVATSPEVITEAVRRMAAALD
ncbi:MalY/PatB family protein [Dermacoccaceae bacterium W4C1]